MRFRILPPFGDGTTVHEATAAMDMAEDGTEALAGAPVAFRQYLIGDVFYADNNLEAVTDGN